MRIEDGFERWGHSVYARPWRTILLCLAGVAILASQLPRLEIDTSSEAFLEPDHPTRIFHNVFREQFGTEDVAVVAIQTDEVFDLAFLSRLRTLHEALEEGVPHLVDVTSLVNVRDTRGVGDELLVDDFLEDWPENEADLLPLRARALGNPLYLGVLLSEDATLATLMVEAEAFSSAESLEDATGGFEDDAVEDAATEGLSATPRIPLTGVENSEFVAAILEITERFDGPDFHIHIAGQPVLVDRVMSKMLADMGRFAGLSLLLIGGLLVVLFRSPTAVLLTLSTACLCVLSGFSFMAAAGLPLTTATQITPTFLMAVSVGNSVHLIAIYLQQLRNGKGREEALAFALRHSGLAIAMTGLTTAGSLLSFLSSGVAMVSDFGIIGPVGVVIALLLSLALLPALIALSPIRAGKSAAPAFNQIPQACGRLGARHPVATTAVWALLFAGSLVGALRVEFSNYSLGWFRPEDPLRIAMELVDDSLGGASSFELVVDSGRENGLYDPALLRRIESAQSFAERQTLNAGRWEVGRTTLSVVQVVKEIHQALHANDPAAYVLPDDRNLVAQELFLFENSGTDDLEDVVDSQFQIARVSIKLPIVDYVHAVILLEDLRQGFGEIFEPTEQFRITGQTSIGATTTTQMIRSLARTYLLAFAIITPFMMLLLGSLRMGLLSMLPAMGAILITLGGMGWLGVPLEAFTLLTACIALGLAVDDTIHFMHNFARARQEGAAPEEAIQKTLASTGQALFFTSIVLTAGFLVYTQASLTLLFNFGAATAFAISMAFLANVNLAPALVTLAARFMEHDAPQKPA